MERQVIHDQVAGVSTFVETGYLGGGDLRALVRMHAETAELGARDVSIGAGYDLYGLSQLIHALVAAHAELKAVQAGAEAEVEPEPEHGSAVPPAGGAA